MNGTWGSSGRTGTSGSGSYVGIWNLVTPCCGSESTTGPVIDNDISFYCKECGKSVLRENFITFEEYKNDTRYKKLQDILNE